MTVDPMSNSRTTRSLPSLATYGLVASLAVNLFLAGLWAGTLGQRFGGLFPHGSERFSARITRLLSSSEKAALAQNLADLDVVVHKGWSTTDQARDKVEAAVRAETFDKAEFANALAELRDKDNAMRSSIDAEFSLILARLPQETRVSISQEMFMHRPPVPPPE